MIIECQNQHLDNFGGLLWLGRGAKEVNLYTEICEGIHPYGITRHRHGEFLSAYTFLSYSKWHQHQIVAKVVQSELLHVCSTTTWYREFVPDVVNICLITVPEIEQGLSDAVGSDVTISFTPNLMPMVIICIC